MNYILRLLLASVEFPLLLLLETKPRVFTALVYLSLKRVFAFTKLEWELCHWMVLGFPPGSEKGSGWSSK